MDFFIFASEQWMLFALLAVLIYAFFMNERVRGGTMVTTAQLVALVNTKDAKVVDLRDAKDFKTGCIVDSINIPFSQVDRRMAEISSDKPIVLVDKIGQHTGSIGSKLKKAGIEVYRLGGGIEEWKNSNLPLVKG